MKKIVVLVAIIATSTLLFGQDPDKAWTYFENEKYELAAKEFESCLPEMRAYFGKNDTTVYSKYIFYTAQSYFFDQQHKKAEKYFLQGKEIFERINGQTNPKYLYYLKGLTNIYGQLGENDKAILTLQEALQKFEKIHGKSIPNYADLLNALGDVFFNLVQYDKVLPLYLEAIEIREKLLGKEHPSYSTSLNKLASLYFEMGQYEEAEKYYHILLENVANIEGKSSKKYCLISNNLASFYYVLGLYNKSLEIMLEVDSISNIVYLPEDRDRIAFANNLALYYYAAGKYEKSLEKYQNLYSYSIDLLGENHPRTLDISLGMIEVYYEIGLFNKANNLIDRALNIIIENQDTITFPNYWKFINYKGMIFDLIGSYEQAISSFENALEIISESYGKTNQEYLIVQNNLAQSYANLGQSSKAIEIYKSINEAFKIINMNQHPLLCTVSNNLALLYYSFDDYNQSLYYFEKAKDISLSLLGPDHSDTRILIFNYGIVLSNDSTKFDDAYKLFEQVSSTDLKYLKNIFSGLDEKTMEQTLSTNSYRFKIIQSFLIKQAETIKLSSNLFYSIELATKGMILQSGIQMRQGILNSGDDEAIQKFNEWFVIRASLAKQYSLPLAQRSNDLKDIELQAEKLESELNRLSNTFKQAQTLGSIKWQDVQQQLGENEVAIEFSSFPYYNGKQWTDSVLYTANVLRPGDEHPQLVYLCEQRQLDSLLYRLGNTEPGFVANLYRGAEIIETSMPSNGQLLYELIWKPIAHLLPEGGTVYFAPSGSLHQIAHAAIPVDENTLLSDKYKLVQLSTTAALLQDDDRNETLTGEIALFGGIEYNLDADEFIALSGQHQDIGYQLIQQGIPAGLERSTEAWSYLPGTLTEVEAIGKLAVKQGVGLKSYTGKDALEDRFKELSGNKSPYILHIATHAFFFPDPEKEMKNENFMLMGEQQQVFRASDNPLNRAGLLFAGANHTWQGDTLPEGVDDGILTAWEATNLTLANTRLVTLSACETGLGEVRGSEGVFGLQRAFKAAGAGYLLMSLWKVPDKETAEFMAFFYARLFEGTTITDAFHATQQHMKTQYPTEPYKWAAFILLK